MIMRRYYTRRATRGARRQKGRNGVRVIEYGRCRRAGDRIAEREVRPHGRDGCENPLNTTNKRAVQSQIAILYW